MTHQREPLPQPTTRRRALSLMAGAVGSLALAACAGENPSGVVRDGGSALTAPAHSAVTIPSTTSGPSATSSPGIPHHPLPSLASIRARFGSMQPQAWGLDIPGIATNNPTQHVVLTFDACGGPGGQRFDSELIGTLRKHQVKATLFINTRWARAHMGLTRELLDDPLFEIGNHGFHHLPLSVNGQAAYGIPGTASLEEVYDEVTGNQHFFREQGWTVPRAFRPGTAYYDNVAVDVVRACGLLPLNFSVNSDAGATFPAEVVTQQLAGVKAGDTVIGHFNQPGQGTAGGFIEGLPAMLGRGLSFAHASEAFSV